MSNRQVVVPPTQYVSNLGAGEHGILIYNSRKEMRNIHFAFVKSGLENNWGVVYADSIGYIYELHYKLIVVPIFSKLLRSKRADGRFTKIGFCISNTRYC